MKTAIHDKDRKNNQIQNKEIIGVLIRQKRLEKGFTIDELAEKAEITPNFLGGIERGRDMPSLANLIKIANVLTVGVDSLLGDNLLLNKCLVGDMETNIENLLETCTEKEKLYLLEMLKVYKRF